MTGNEGGQLELVQRYQQLAETYEALDAKIDGLMAANRHNRDQMSVEDLRQYRDWARQRSEILNDMRLLERDLNLGTDDSARAI